MTSEGYVKLHRALIEHPIFKQLSSTVLRVWIACLLRANWKPTKWYDGQQQVEIPAGAFVFSQATLAKLCGLSRKEVRTALKHLQKLQCVVISGAKYQKKQYRNGASGEANIGASRYSLLVIENWTTYQSDENTRGQQSGQETGHQGASMGPQKKKLKNIRTPLPPEGEESRDAYSMDFDDLPFAPTLEPFPPEMVNGNNCSAGRNGNGNGHAPAIAEVIEGSAKRIHGRHPVPARDIGVGLRHSTPGKPL